MKHQLKIALFTSLAAISNLLGCSNQSSSLPDHPFSPDSAECYLDTQARDGKFITFAGWAKLNNNLAPIGVAIKPEYSTEKTTTSYTNDMFDRPDVAKSLSNPNLLKTGFTIKTISADYPEGSKIQIFAEGQNLIYLCKGTYAVK